MAKGIYNQRCSKKRKTVLQILPSVITDIYFFKPNLMGNITMTITKLRLYPELGPAQPQLVF